MKNTILKKIVKKPYILRQVDYIKQIHNTSILSQFSYQNYPIQSEYQIPQQQVLSYKNSNIFIQMILQYKMNEKQLKQLQKLRQQTQMDIHLAYAMSKQNRKYKFPITNIQHQQQDQDDLQLQQLKLCNQYDLRQQNLIHQANQYKHQLQQLLLSEQIRHHQVDLNRINYIRPLSIVQNNSKTLGLSFKNSHNHKQTVKRRLLTIGQQKISVEKQRLKRLVEKQRQLKAINSRQKLIINRALSHGTSLKVSPKNTQLKKNQKFQIFHYGYKQNKQTSNDYKQNKQTSNDYKQNKQTSNDYRQNKQTSTSTNIINPQKAQKQIIKQKPLAQKHCKSEKTLRKTQCKVLFPKLKQQIISKGQLSNKLKTQITQQSLRIKQIIISKLKTEVNSPQKYESKYNKFSKNKNIQKYESKYNKFLKNKNIQTNNQLSKLFSNQKFKNLKYINHKKVIPYQSKCDIQTKQHNFYLKYKYKQ